MIPFDQYKKLILKEDSNLIDEEIEEIRDAQYQFAEIAFDA